MKNDVCNDFEKSSEVGVPGISAGMFVRNYREMCRLLGEQEKAGKSKIIQMEKWSKRFRYEKDGHSFRILEVYDAEKINDFYLSEDHCKGKTGKYSQYIVPVLLDRLCGNEGGKISVSFTKKELFFTLGLVNEYYPSVEDMDYSFEIKKDSKRSGKKEVEVKNGKTLADRKQFYWFQNIVQKKLNSVVNSALEAMLKEGLIRISDEYSVKPDGGRSFIANLNQEQIIRNARERVLKDMGLKDFKSVVVGGKLKTFYKKFNGIISDEQKWSAVYTRTKISLAVSRDKAKKIIALKCGGEFDRERYRKMLNREIAKYFRGNIKDRKDKFDADSFKNTGENADPSGNADKNKLVYWLDKLGDEVMSRKGFISVQRSFIRDFIIIS